MRFFSSRLMGLPFLLVAWLSVACSGSSNPPVPDSAVIDSPPLQELDPSQIPHLFGQSLYTSQIPMRVEFSSNGVDFITSRELSYSESSRTLTEVFRATSGVDDVSVAERISTFNEFGQLVSESILRNGAISETTDYGYEDGLLVRMDVREDMDGEIIQSRQALYDDSGRLTSAEITDPRTGELLRTESREYTENGWVSTYGAGSAFTRITTELDENGQAVRSTQVVTINGVNGLHRTIVRTFDENNQLVTSQRFRGNELLNEVRYSEFANIDGLIHDTVHQWDVFFNASSL